VVSQSSRILQALQRGDRLTPMDALDRFGCFRLAARIDDLKKHNHDIRAELVKRGDAVVAEYSMVPAGELFATARRWE
jgi:hypothetical protein